jgi:membrane protein insertase Oxa1/YidC/SpoIIIJ
MGQLYKFVPNPGTINSVFLGLIDLSKSAVSQVDKVTAYYIPAFFLVVLSGIAQVIQAKMMVPKSKNLGGKKEALSQAMGMMQNQMVYFTPIFISLIFLRVPAALSLYLLTTSLFSIVQQRKILQKNA